MNEFISLKKINLVLQPPCWRPRGPHTTLLV